MRLPYLYHWSPTDRRESILKDGLQIYSDEPVPLDFESDEPAISWPWICLAATPSGAWSLCPGGMNRLDERDWDLFQIDLQAHDDVHVLMDGDNICEIRVNNTVPADRVWYVGTRKPPEGKPRKRKRAPTKKN